jgi:hypothetical protein
MEALLGLIGLGLVWVGALCLWAWSWDRHVQLILAAGFDVESEHRNLQSGELVWLQVRSHTIGWSAFFFAFFALQGLAGFPVWKRLGLACVLSVTYAYGRTAREVGQGPERVPLLTPWADKVWYFSILSAEWLGYFGVLVFLGQFFVEAAK